MAKPRRGHISELDLQNLHPPLTGGWMDDATGNLYERSWAIIDPRWPSIIFFAHLQLAALVYTVIVTPVEIGFSELTNQNITFFFLCNRVVDLVFLTDCVFNFFLMYPRKDDELHGAWVRNNREIAINYLRGWFLPDFLALIPFDFIEWVVIRHCAELDFECHNQSAFSDFRILKGLRTIRFARVFRFFRATKQFDFIANKLNIGNHTWALLKSLGSSFMYAHLMASVWGYTLVMASDGDDRWIDAPLHNTSNTFFWKYISALHFSFTTITSVGYGDIIPASVLERGVCIALMFAGGIAWTMVIGSCASVEAQISLEAHEKKRTIHEVNLLIQAANVPPDLARRFREFFYRKRSNNDRLRLPVLLADCPKGLSNEVLAYAFNPILRNVWVLKHVPDSMIAAIVPHLRIETYVAQETFGDICTLYIQQSGISALQASVRILTRGSIWGQDFALDSLNLVENPRVTALTFSEVMYLRKKRFFRILDEFPNSYKVVRKSIIRLALWRACVMHCAQIEQDRCVRSGSMESLVEAPLQHRKMMFVKSKSFLEEIPTHLRRRDSCRSMLSSITGSITSRIFLTSGPPKVQAALRNMRFKDEVTEISHTSTRSNSEEVDETMLLAGVDAATYQRSSCGSLPRQDSNIMSDADAYSSVAQADSVMGGFSQKPISMASGFSPHGISSLHSPTEPPPTLHLRAEPMHGQQGLNSEPMSVSASIKSSRKLSRIPSLLESSVASFLPSLPGGVGLAAKIGPSHGVRPEPAKCDGISTRETETDKKLARIEATLDNVQVVLRQRRILLNQVLALYTERCRAAGIPESVPSEHSYLTASSSS